MNFEILTGDNRETLKTLADNSVDAIVTDPPYGIDFLGKDWDANTGAVETYTECLRVLKPGGHILAFSAARTYHHLAVTLERAGFEIRDQLMWLYSSGFPKAQDIGKNIEKREGNTRDKQRFSKEELVFENDHYTHKTTGKRYRKLPDINGDRLATSMEGEKYGAVYEEIRELDNPWSGWKTGLKPAHEPICMARKPFKGSTIDNVLAHGVGALNIDATRIEYEGPNDKPVPHGGKARQHKDNPGWMSGTGHKIIENPEINPIGRFPSNVLGEVDNYQKYFYCPKVSRAERHCGFEQKDIPTSTGGMYDNHGTGVMYNIGTDMKSKKSSLDHIPGIGGGNQMAHLPGDKNSKLKAVEKASAGVGNNHPTVKPVELMKYLIKLVTPPNGIVLDPFNGSGSTGMAAVELGHTYIGCELDPAYVDIATRRITAWNTPESTGTTFEELFSVEDK